MVPAENGRWNLFVEERDNLLAYVKRIAPMGCDDVDIVQEVGLRLLRQTDVAACREQVMAWCKSVARHILLHELRAARYERAKIAALNFDSVPDVWESERRAALRLTLTHELERMDPTSRDLVLRRYVLEQTSQEIARDVELNPPAVRMRLMRIREELGSRTADGEESAPKKRQTR